MTEEGLRKGRQIIWGAVAGSFFTAVAILLLNNVSSTIVAVSYCSVLLWLWYDDKCYFRERLGKVSVCR